VALAGKITGSILRADPGHVGRAHNEYKQVVQCLVNDHAKQQQRLIVGCPENAQVKSHIRLPVLAPVVVPMPLRGKQHLISCICSSL